MPSHTHEECTIVKNTACIERLRRRKGGRGDVERKLKLPMCTRVRVEGNALLVVVVMWEKKKRPICLLLYDEIVFYDFLYVSLSLRFVFYSFIFFYCSRFSVSGIYNY